MSELKPVTRKEAYWAAVADDSVTPPEPQTTEECILAAMSGNYPIEDIKPQTRMQGVMKQAVDATQKAMNKEIVWDKNTLTLVYANRQALTKVTIPEGVTVIGSGAFKDYVGLESVTIPDSVTDMLSGAFYGCTALTDVTLSKNIKRTGNSTFYGCTALTNVVIPEDVITIDSQTFYNTGLTSVTIPDSVTTIGVQAFAGCDSLTDVTIGSGLINFIKNPFENTPWLESKRAEDPLVVVNGILIDGYACTGEVVIPDGVTSIIQCAFENSSLTSVTIPDSVTNIGDATEKYEIGAFQNCPNLTTVIMGNGLTSIGSATFWNSTNLTDIYVPWTEDDARNANAPWGATNATIHYNYTGE